MDAVSSEKRLDYIILILGAIAFVLAILCLIRQMDVTLRNFEVDSAAMDVIEAQKK